ncbi:MAG: hypothetical protein IIB38_03225 [Candidatus Hydrogenedentes bacterium]|nr:hypothetical protein [Candidatus Hydrogenedentota bacterium]
MAGEHQLAERVLGEALKSACAEEGMSEDIFARALMIRLVEYYRAQRSQDDIISELEQHIRTVEDGDEPVITRGC